MSLFTTLVQFFHKIVTHISHKILKTFNAATIGSRAIIINENNQVLLVKHTYQKHWYIPGGGVKAGEPVLHALLRELEEEVGVHATLTPTFFGIYHNDFKGVNDYPVVYVIDQFSMEAKYSPEIEKWAWFPLNYLPEDISPGTRRRIKEYLGESVQSLKW